LPRIVNVGQVNTQKWKLAKFAVSRGHNSNVRRGCNGAENFDG
jgi:hypothetical protein